MKAILVIIYTGISAVIILPVLLFFPFSRLSEVYMKFWAKITVKLSGNTVSVEGLDNIHSDTAYVITANHQSQMDIPLLLACLPLQFRMAAKKELFMIPVLGWVLYAMQFIKIDRKNKSRAVKSLNQAALKIEKGLTILFFPEGTRSTGGKLLPFNSGPFYLAVKAGVPVLPVVISGSNKIHNKQKVLKLNAGNEVKIVIGKPLATVGLDLKQRHQLLAHTREVMAAMYNRIKSYSL